MSLTVFKEVKVKLKKKSFVEQASIQCARLVDEVDKVDKETQNCHQSRSCFAQAFALRLMAKVHELVSEAEHITQNQTLFKLEVSKFQELEDTRGEIELKELLWRVRGDLADLRDKYGTVLLAEVCLRPSNEKKNIKYSICRIPYKTSENSRSRLNAHG
jgi:hypothetical protein